PPERHEEEDIGEPDRSDEDGDQPAQGLAGQAQDILDRADDVRLDRDGAQGETEEEPTCRRDATPLVPASKAEDGQPDQHDGDDQAEDPQEADRHRGQCSAAQTRLRTPGTKRPNACRGARSSAAIRPATIAVTAARERSTVALIESWAARSTTGFATR